jgi:hypothetical protein
MQIIGGMVKGPKLQFKRMPQINLREHFLDCILCFIISPANASFTMGEVMESGRGPEFGKRIRPPPVAN